MGKRERELVDEIVNITLAYAGHVGRAFWPEEIDVWVSLPLLQRGRVPGAKTPTVQHPQKEVR